MMGPNRKIMAAAVVACAFGATTASAEFLDFDIDEGSVPLAADNLITVDKLTGPYSEILTIDLAGNFESAAYAEFESTTINEGTTSVPNQMGALPDAGYRLYAIFGSTGTFAGTFTGVTGFFDLYIDPAQDTALTLPDPLAGGTAGDGVDVNDVSGDDYQVALASSPETLIGIPGSPGAYRFVWDDFTLTADGLDYFVDPDPFHMRVVVTGDFDEDTFLPGTTIQSGDVSAVFQVPEPGALALLGLGLAGLGVARRRRSV